MATAYRKPASHRGKRTNACYGDLVKLASQISGRSLSTIYAVLSNRITSKPVTHAIEVARQQLTEGRSEKSGVKILASTADVESGRIVVRPSLADRKGSPRSAARDSHVAFRAISQRRPPGSTAISKRTSWRGCSTEPSRRRTPWSSSCDSSRSPAVACRPMRDVVVGVAVQNGAAVPNGNTGEPGEKYYIGMQRVPQEILDGWLEQDMRFPPEYLAAPTPRPQGPEQFRLRHGARVLRCGCGPFGAENRRPDRPPSRPSGTSAFCARWYPP